MSLIGCLYPNRRRRMTRMADLFADALMLAIRIFMVSELVVVVVILVVDLAHDKARMKKEKEVDSDDL